MMDMPEKQIIMGMDLAKGDSFSAIHMPYEQYETLKRKADIATQLAEALQLARNCIDLQEPEDMDKMDHNTLKQIDLALSRYHGWKT